MIPWTGEQWTGPHSPAIPGLITYHHPGKGWYHSSFSRVSILHTWQKKTAVALNKGFYDTLPPMRSVSKEEAEIAWLIYDLELIEERDQKRYALTKNDEVFTEFEPALLTITTPLPGMIEDFINLLQDKLDEQLETPPNNKTIERVF